MALKPKSRPEQLADAYVAVAKANHYMVGIVGAVTPDERDDAEQILIRRQNAVRKDDVTYRGQGYQHRLFDLALDVLEHDRTGAQRAPAEPRPGRFTIDGTTPSDEYDGGSNVAPFAVHDSKAQTWIAAGLPERWMAVAIMREAIGRYGND